MGGTWDKWQINKPPQFSLVNIKRSRRKSGPRRNEVTESGENHIMRSLMICTSHQILFA
jgi:hypothetical protein